MSTDSKYKNPFDFSKEYELHKIFENMISLKKKSEDAMAKAEAIAGFVDGLAFQPLANADIRFPNVSELHANRKSSYSRKLSLEELRKSADELIRQAEIKIQMIEEHNAPLIIHNNKVRSIVVSTLAKLGIKEVYETYDYPTARHRNKKTMKHTSGFVDDLRRVQPTSDTESCKQAVKSFSNSVADYISREAEKEKQEALKADEEAIQKIILADPTIIGHLAEAGIDLDERLKSAATGEKKSVIRMALMDAVHRVLSKDKYLHLAHYLEMNRGDWSDGYQYAETGLRGFKVESGLDQKIYDCIQEFLDETESFDGRVFRNCEYNYNVLYGLVKDPALKPLLEKLTEHQRKHGFT